MLPAKQPPIIDGGVEGTSNDIQNVSPFASPDRSDAVKRKSALEHVTGILQDRDVDSILEKLFHVKRRDTTWELECICGFVQFVSCMYVLPVVPIQLRDAGFDVTATINTTALTCGVGCLVAGIFANLPFIVAPPTAVSIFYSVFIQQNNVDVDTASTAVMISGMLLILFGYGPFGKFATKLIPHSIQAGTAVGIGMITALAGATEISLVQTGKYTIVDIGQLTDEVVIAMAGFILIAVALFYHVKGAFCIALVFNTIVWWAKEDAWPSSLAEIPSVERIESFAGSEDKQERNFLIFQLIFLCLLTLSGLVNSLSHLSHLTRDDGTTPRNRWLFIICGLTTVLSGYLRGPPILISPESAAGIKAGAKTGLSTCVCGVCFVLATFFSPVMSEVPNAATAPLLLAVGVLLMQNAKRIDWGDINSAFPAFCCVFFIPFTYNILFGVGFGYVAYLSIGVLTGYFYQDAMTFYDHMFVKKDPKEILLSAGISTDSGVSSLNNKSRDLAPRASLFSLNSAMDSVDGNVAIVEGFYNVDDDVSARRSSLFCRPRNTTLSGNVRSADYYNSNGGM